MLRINVLGGLFVTGEGRPLSGAAAQPRRLALLALLAVAGDRGATRDALIAYLWPDADEERGRRALTQALYALRRDLGSDEALLGLKDLRLNPDQVTSDYAEFHDTLAAGDLERAAECYRGPFLDGFHLPEADPFERWAEEQRSGLAHEWSDLLEQLAARCSQRGDHRGAVGWLRKLAAQDPMNAQVAARLMRSLAAGGDVAGALQHARVYETLVRQELDLAPDREVVALAEQLRTGQSRAAPAEAPTSTPPAPSPPLAPAPASAPAPAPAADPPSRPSRPSGSLDLGHTSGWAVGGGVGLGAAAEPPPHGMQAWRRRARWAVVVVVAALLVPLTRHVWRAHLIRSAAMPAPERVVAVGRISHYAATGAGALGAPMADMLATNLARTRGLRVVSNARMVEVMRQVPDAADSAAASVAAARQSGATELVDGALYDLAPGRMRLDLRRVDLASGAVLEAYTVEGENLFLLADSGTARLLRDLGGTPLAGSLADVSTRSVRAYQLYEEGLRLYYEGERADAERRFQEALTADSAFAMAQFFYALSTSPGLRTETVARLRRAVDLARRASDRERLLVNAAWAFVNTSPSLRAIAETLMVRYPAELEGYLMAGQAAILAGDYEAAHGPLETVIARDSLGLRGSTPRCLACEAMPALYSSYIQEDSIAEAVAVGRRWTRLQPESGTAWRMLAMLLAQSGAFAAADSALARADSLLPRDPKAWRYHSANQLWRWDFATAAEVVRGQLHSADPDERVEASWMLAVVLRQQGRLEEALVAARRYRATRGEQSRPGAAPTTALLEAQVLFEQGAYRAAAALFDSVARGRVTGEDSSAVSRNRVWALTHAAGVLAAQGDTTRLAGLADTIRVLGRQSAFARDQRLHSYVDGLLALARGRDGEAVQLFRRSILSPNVGYTRVNLVLGRTLTRLGRPREAVAILQSALRGMFEGSNLYVTHTDLSEALAEAFEAAGQRDSAAYHYQRLVKAWEGADPRFTPRIANARGRAMLMLERRP